MTRRIPIAVAIIVLAVSSVCLVSVTSRADGLRLTTASAVVSVEGRRRNPLTPEEQARRDHLRAERARRWGIFSHYLIGGLAASTVNPLSWVTGTIGSLFGFAWSVGMDLLLLVGFGLLLFVAACFAGLYGSYKAIQWLFSRGK